MPSSSSSRFFCEGEIFDGAFVDEVSVDKQDIWVCRHDFLQRASSAGDKIAVGVADHELGIAHDSHTLGASSLAPSTPITESVTKSDTGRFTGGAISAVGSSNHISPEYCVEPLVS